MNSLFPQTTHAATLSDCGRYRYWLLRRWDSIMPLCVWIMLNPSTADARQDDPTIRRCMGFARRWNYGGILVLNLFAFRASDPLALIEAEDPEGPDNDATLRHILQVYSESRIICAWGNDGVFQNRAREVCNLLQEIGITPLCLGVTKQGQPRHPLYLRRDLQPQPYSPPELPAEQGQVRVEIISPEGNTASARVDPDCDTKVLQSLGVMVDKAHRAAKDGTLKLP